MSPTPEWYAADEDDADRTPTQNRTLSPETARNVSTPTNTPPDAREALLGRLAEAIGQVLGCKPYDGPWNALNQPVCDRHSDWIWTEAGCPVAVAASEAVLPLVAAQVEAAVSVVRADSVPRATYEQMCNEADKEMFRAESAEADLRALRGGLEALADEWETEDRDNLPTGDRVHELRALLAPSPAEGVGGTGRPTFEQLLADPNEQFDVNGEVAQAILDATGHKPSRLVPTAIAGIQHEAWMAGECGNPIEEVVQVATASAKPSKPVTWIADLCGLPKLHSGACVKRGDLDNQSGAPQ